MELKNQKNKYTMGDLLNLVDVLRSPKGSPWDKLRTHSDIRTNLIEEAYDVIEALDIGDSETLKEELGDVLLQIAFHCSIAKDDNSFDFEDIIDSVCEKIISRHPHIFYGTDYSKKSYESNKPEYLEVNSNVNGRRYFESRSNNKFQSCDLNQEKLRSRDYQSLSPAESVSNVSKILPSLMRTERVQERAAKGGFGLFSVDDALNECFERFHYLESLIIQGKSDDYNREIGNLLFSVTEIARLINVDAECALYDSCERFKDEILYKLARNRRT